MKCLFLVMGILLSFCSFGKCDSKIRSRVYRQLKNQGIQVSISNVHVTHKQKMEIDQGAALVKEMDLYEVEVLGAAMSKFSGMSEQRGTGCRVTHIRPMDTLRI